MNELELDEREWREKMRKDSMRDQAMRDMAFICNCPEGQRVLLAILQDLGLGRTPEGAERETHLAATRILRQIGEASPQSAHWILGEIFGVRQ